MSERFSEGPLAQPPPRRRSPLDGVEQTFRIWLILAWTLVAIVLAGRLAFSGWPPVPSLTEAESATPSVTGVVTGEPDALDKRADVALALRMWAENNRSRPPIDKGRLSTELFRDVVKPLAATGAIGEAEAQEVVKQFVDSAAKEGGKVAVDGLATVAKDAYDRIVHHAKDDGRKLSVTCLMQPASQATPSSANSIVITESRGSGRPTQRCRAANSGANASPLAGYPDF